MTTTSTAGCCGAGHQTGHRSARHRPRLRPWAPALGRRARLRAPTQLPPPADPLRALPRDPHRAARPRLLDPLLATPQVIVKGLLSALRERLKAAAGDRGVMPASAARPADARLQTRSRW